MSKRTSGHVQNGHVDMPDTATAFSLSAQRVPTVRGSSHPKDSFGHFLMSHALELGELGFAAANPNSRALSTGNERKIMLKSVRAHVIPVISIF